MESEQCDEETLRFVFEHETGGANHDGALPELRDRAWPLLRTENWQRWVQCWE